MKKLIINFLDKKIKEYYLRKGNEGFTLPFYINVSNYELAFYAMNMDYESLRIKLSKDSKIIKVFKK
jgi:hypothetical protein